MTWWTDNFPETTASWRRLREAWREYHRVSAELRLWKRISRLADEARRLNPRAGWLLDDANTDIAHVFRVDEARRAGTEEPLPYVRELVVVASSSAPILDWFDRDTRRHKIAPHIQVWWPGLGIKAVMGLELNRVTVDSSVELWITRRSVVEDLLHLRSRGRHGRPPLWLEF